MVLQYIKAKLSILPRVFSPTLSAIFSTFPFWQRWRLLLLQPINILGATLCAPTWLFNNRYSVIYIPTRNGSRRCLVFQPPRSTSTKQGDCTQELRPLHIDIHGGAWIGGFPEQGARFSALLSDRTGAVVVCPTYGIAPRHLYPAAHDDTDDIVTWLVTHAEELGADRKLLTIGGSSVGGTLALSASQHLHHLEQKQVEGGTQTGPIYAPLALVAFCPVLTFHVPPTEKPVPPEFPKNDPLSFMLPMYDIYAGTNRPKHLQDPRLHPILAARETLPPSIMIVAAGIDILLAEQLEFEKKMQTNTRDENFQLEFMLVEEGFHGFIELPSFILEKERCEVFERAIGFVKEAHRKAGFKFVERDDRSVSH